MPAPAKTILGPNKVFSSPRLLCNLIPRQNNLSSPGMVEYLAYSSVWNACTWKNFGGPKKFFSSVLNGSAVPQVRFSSFSPLNGYKRGCTWPYPILSNTHSIYGKWRACKHLPCYAIIWPCIQETTMEVETPTIFHRNVIEPFVAPGILGFLPVLDGYRWSKELTLESSDFSRGYVFMITNSDLAPAHCAG